MSTVPLLQKGSATQAKAQSSVLSLEQKEDPRITDFVCDLELYKNPEFGNVVETSDSNNERWFALTSKDGEISLTEFNFEFI